MKDDISYGHYRRYSKDEIINKVKKQNFKIIHVEMFGYPFLHYLRIMANYLTRDKEIEEWKEDKTKKSSYESVFDDSLISKLGNWLNESNFVLYFLLLQNIFSKQNKGLAVIVVAQNSKEENLK